MTHSPMVVQHIDVDDLMRLQIHFSRSAELAQFERIRRQTVRTASVLGAIASMLAVWDLSLLLRMSG